MVNSPLAERSCRIEIPLLPASINHYVEHKARGVHVKSNEAKGFENAFSLFVKGEYAVSAVPSFAAKIQIVLPLKKKGDVDNFPKQILDCAAKAAMLRSVKGLQLSDCYVRRLEVEIYDDIESRAFFGPLVRLTIYPLALGLWRREKERPL